jgi:undecaprenyl diphosphate synthase
MSLLRKPLYYVYTKLLLSEVRKDDLPNHLGLILDGNRRFAKEKGLKDESAGHKKGADKLDEVLKWCLDLGIRIITIWVLSTENLSRDSREVEKLLQVIEDKIKDLSTNPQIHNNRVRIKAVGRLEILPVSTQEAIKQAEDATSEFEDYYLNIAIGYSGRQEIADAFKKLLEEKQRSDRPIEEIAKEINPEIIGRYMYEYELPDPDLIIRTSGEIRLSGFLLWQSAYSEFYFCDVFWPSFRRIDLLRAVRSYQQRQRRFGK